MSTEHQKYSTENQADIIAGYAERRGFEIVKTYADQGKSGLRIDGREALKRLLADVQAGRADYDVILVYDVSRWGRFQDADESAYYEYLCREAGISVHYCAEQFENDGSLTATIIKGMKRAMAGEYSRELSAKVFTGQCRLIGLGYRQGGPAGFGLRRQLVDEQRRPKALLDRGEHKSLQTDRVILTAGPQDEIDVVQRIYRMFVLQRRSEREIAVRLNAEGIATDLDRPWTRGTVHQVLTNEKYIGNNVYNRVSFKLKKKRVLNAPDAWVRADGAFQGIVDPEFFAAAQRIISDRTRRFTDEELLERLTELLGRKGCLSGLLIDEVEDMPSSSTYRQRFGTLLRAYQLVGYDTGRDYRYLETNRVLRALHPDVVSRTVAEVERLGGAIRVDPVTDLLTVNDEITVSVTVVRCSQTAAGGLRWKLRLDAGLKPDITIAVRMDATNTVARDYYLLPWLDVGPMGRVRMAEANGIFLDAFRFDDLDAFFELTRRTSIRIAA
ncbi:recombinase family protein [Brevundimonas nasdae]|uniref:Recombinase family protein n=2 Tax=Brevundimonas nasdae TaxID=172043 RepID=A0ABX8TKF8_9CAUL|nr:recombinase family protein [Brevundimonas nasdae]QYC11494.1 recombinase family protein [Brevundimonas nasdae]QYC14282.1 recombinase family protein [Brevundimonas nasdae]